MLLSVDPQVDRRGSRRSLRRHRGGGSGRDRVAAGGQDRSVFHGIAPLCQPSWWPPGARGGDFQSLFATRFGLGQWRRVVARLELSTRSELTLALRWLGILHGRVDASLAASGGVQRGQDVLKAIAAGASVVEVASVLYRSGVQALGDLRRGRRRSGWWRTTIRRSNRCADRSASCAAPTRRHSLGPITPGPSVVLPKRRRESVVDGRESGREGLACLRLCRRRPGSGGLASDLSFLDDADRTNRGRFSAAPP